MDLIILNNQVRRFSPLECERLQTLPDNYTDGVSNTQRYKMLGNAFTIDVIAHILSYMIETHTDINVSDKSIYSYTYEDNQVSLSN